MIDTTFLLRKIGVEDFLGADFFPGKRHLKNEYIFAVMYAIVSFVPSTCQVSVNFLRYTLPLNPSMTFTSGIIGALTSHKMGPLSII